MLTIIGHQVHANIHIQTHTHVIRHIYTLQWLLKLTTKIKYYSCVETRALIHCWQEHKIVQTL